MNTLDEFFAFLEGWVGPRHNECGLSNDALGELPLPEPLRRLLEFAGSWTNPDFGHRLFDARSFRLQLPPYSEIGTEVLDGLSYYLGDRVDSPHFVFATDSLDGWEAVAAAECTNVVVTFEGEAYEQPLESWLVRLCMRALVYGRPAGELSTYEDLIAGRIEEAELLIENASPFPPPVNPDFLRPEPIWLIDGRVLATPKLGMNNGEYVLAARDSEVLEDLRQRG